MARSLSLFHAPDTLEDPIGELVPLDFHKLERLLLAFCASTMRNPRSKELEDMIEACRKEE